MGLRMELHEMICEKLEEIPVSEARKRVYYQPPASVKLTYPCVIYRLEDMPSVHANNLPYHTDHVYQLTVIDRDPESVIREKIAELPTCRFERAFVTDNLNHYIFRIYH